MAFSVIGSTLLGGRQLVNPNIAAARTLTQLSPNSQSGRAAATFIEAQTKKVANAVNPYAMAFTHNFNYQQEGVPPDPLTDAQWVALIPGMIVDYEFIHAINTPSIRFDQQGRFENGKIHNYPGVMSMDDVTVTFMTEITGTAPSFLSEWIRSVRSMEGIYNLPAAYRKTLIVAILDQRGNVIMEFHYENVWPVSWSGYSLKFGTPSPLFTEVTLNVDDVKIYTPSIDERESRFI